MQPHSITNQSRANSPCPSLLGAAPGSEVGSVIGEFQLLEYLGRGGMADVYAAAHLETGERVALKRMLPWLVKRTHLLELFFHEARVYASLSHPNVVRGIDVALDGNVPYLVLELVEGLPCDALLRRMGPFPLGVALTLIHDLLGGLAHVHEARDGHGRPLGIVHHDIAPDNVIVSHSGNVKLCDFGVAHSLLTGGPMQAAELRGKLGYASPEHLGGIATDARADLFAVGVLLSEMVIGRRLFRNRTKFELTVSSFNVDQDALAVIDESLPTPVRDVVYRALTRNRALRFQSARELDDALVLASHQISRSLEVDEVRDWLARTDHRPPQSGTFEVPKLERARDLSARIDEVHAAVRSRPDPSAPVVQIDEWRRSPGRLPETARHRVRVGPYAEIQELSYAELIAGVVTGRFGADTPVAHPREGWIALQQLPGFSQLLALPAYQPLGTEAGMARPLERSKLPRLLFDIARGRACGRLCARAGLRWKRIFFDAGVPVFGASSDESELLGARLKALGVVDSHKLEETVSFAFRRGCRLGDALVETHAVNPAEMLRALVRQLEDRVLELGSWTNGEISFVHSLRPGLVAPKPLGTVARLACRLVRERYCDEEVASFLRELGESRVELVLPAPAFSEALLPIEQRVLQRLTRPEPLRSLVDGMLRSNLASPEDTRRALFLVLSAGLVDCPSSRSTAPNLPVRGEKPHRGSTEFG